MVSDDFAGSYEPALGVHAALSAEDFAAVR
jgi:hypothetical protein